MDVEICIENLETALLADKLGAQRVELCSALDLGGLTPSLGMIEACVEACALDIFVMIRPRAGGFVYSASELDIMEIDIKKAKDVGAHGVVFGCLTDDFRLDEYQNKQLLGIAKSLDLGVTFHRAFDRCKSPDEGLERLIDWGFDRILTSGQEKTAIEGLEKIKDWKQRSGGQIEIIAGSGVNASNAKILMEAGADALHFTARKKIIKEDTLGMGDEFVVDVAKIENVMKIIKLRV